MGKFDHLINQLCAMSLGLRVQGLGFRVWGSGFGVQGLGFRVWGSGFGSCLENGSSGARSEEGEKEGEEELGRRASVGEEAQPASGCRVQGLWFIVQVLGLRVQG